MVAKGRWRTCAHTIDEFAASTQCGSEEFECPWCYLQRGTSAAHDRWTLHCILPCRLDAIRRRYTGRRHTPLLDDVHRNGNRILSSCSRWQHQSDRDIPFSPQRHRLGIVRLDSGCTRHYSTDITAPSCPQRHWCARRSVGCGVVSNRSYDVGICYWRWATAFVGCYVPSGTNCSAHSSLQ